jgi:predicted metal-dependent hydrolase
MAQQTSNEPPAAARHPIRPRAPKLPSAEDLPTHWLGGSAAATHLVNGVNLVFPAGERFFTRSVLCYRDRIAEPELLEQVRGFCGQEAHHASAHEKLFDRLRAQGFRIDRYLRVYEAFAYGFLERLAPRALRLSVTAALEHYTAIMAENALRMGTFDRAHPHVRELLLWHSAEEIEHKSVAFDVLQRMHPSYALRLAGLAAATLCLGFFWLLGALMLMRQDREAGFGRLLRELREVQQRNPILRRVFARGIREYVRRDFHPRQNDNLALARGYLAGAGMS